MKNIGEGNGNFKAGEVPWFKFYPRNWLEATRHLTPEQRGAYADVLCLMYQAGKPLRDDDKLIAHQLMISTRRWRAIREALVADGKLIARDGFLTNDRAENEIENRVKQLRNFREICARRERKKRENSKSGNKINETATSALPDDSAETYCRVKSKSKKEEKIAAQSIPEAARDVAALQPDDFKKLSDRLLAAAEPCLDNLANCQGLLSIAVPRMWIEEGCDLDRDVIPTIEAIAKRDKGKRIRSWDYFTRAVAEAKAKRARGLPTVAAPDQKHPQPTFFRPPSRDADAEYAENLALAKRMGIIDEHVH